MSNEPENDELEGLEPVLLDMDEDPAWVHVCGEENELIHLVVSNYRGKCEMNEDHWTEVQHVYDPARARQLAASLLNAADQADGGLPDESA